MRLSIAALHRKFKPYLNLFFLFQKAWTVWICPKTKEREIARLDIHVDRVTARVKHVSTNTFHAQSSWLAYYISGWMFAMLQMGC